MRNIVAALILFVALMVGLVWSVAIADDIGSPQDAGVVQPLVIHLEQTIPFTATVLISEAITVAVPASIDLKIDISLGSGLTPTILTPTLPPILEIGQLEEGKESGTMLERDGRVYSLQPEPGITLVQASIKNAPLGGVVVVGQIRNETGKTVEGGMFLGSSIITTLVDSEGNILDVAQGYFLVDSVADGELAPFEVDFLNDDISIKDVAEVLFQLNLSYSD